MCVDGSVRGGGLEFINSDFISDTFVTQKCSLVVGVWEGVGGRVDMHISLSQSTRYYLVSINIIYLSVVLGYCLFWCHCQGRERHRGSHVHFQSEAPM